MKLGPMPIYSFGVAISIVALSYGYFHDYKPNKEETQLQKNYKDQLETEANKKPQAEKRVRDAVKAVNDSAAEWRAIVMSRTPAKTVGEGGIDLGVNAWQLIPDAKRFRNNLQIAVNQQVKKGGIKLPNGGPTVPDPGNSQQEILATFFNYPALAFPVVLLDLGTITVQGNYDQIIANYKSWSTMPHFMTLVDGLQFTGTSPNLTATYQVQLLAYIRATDIFPPAPEGTLAAAAATPGAPGGPPGAAQQFGGRGAANPSGAPGGAPRGGAARGG